MNLYLTRTFQKRFSKLPKTIQSKIEGALKEIYLDPYSGKRLLGELEDVLVRHHLECLDLFRTDQDGLGL